MKIYGPVNISDDLYDSIYRYIDSPDKKLKDIRYDKTEKELDALIAEFTPEYPIWILIEANKTGLRSHMPAGEIQIDHKFEIDGDNKQYKRLLNPFGDNIVDGKIAAISNDNQIVKIDADMIVRPCLTSNNNVMSFTPIFSTPDEIKTMTEIRIREKENSIIDNICLRVEEYVLNRYHEDGKRKPKEIFVFFSAYKYNNDVIVDNLDQIAIKGKCILTSNKDEFFGGEKSKTYRSEIVENPTRLEVCYLFDRSIHATHDTHHHFLEGVEDTGKVIDDIPVYEFCTGS